MSNVIPIEKALGHQTKRTRYFTVYSTGRIRYTDSGRRHFGAWFSRFGIDIRAIQTERDHLQATRYCDDNEIADVFEGSIKNQDSVFSDSLLDDLLNMDIAHRPTIRDLIAKRSELDNAKARKD
ncbi:hypothetical protein [Marinobacter sp. P4B1]|uniref:hypothetical protein n=1 Tax=Marinobacter sp. P4B1 TaxID=1119533 RepID=UPI00071E291D|nr:hypothetical protein [Marinobacter sp. P4B1]KRW83710.1 hypothetical protein AQ621_16810 [Marinobacter sp. P4B1]